MTIKDLEEGDYIRNRETGEQFIVVSGGKRNGIRAIAVRSVDITPETVNQWTITLKAHYEDREACPRSS